MTTKHSPAPWTIEMGYYESDRVYGIRDANGCKIIETDTGIYGPELEDARLIAAAPELLEACKAQHEAIDRLFALLIERDPEFFPTKSGQPWEACRLGNEVIKKAEGIS